MTQLFRVRSLLGGRQHLSFYRVRCWATRTLRIEVRADRRAEWRSYELPLNSARIGEAVNTALAALLPAGADPDFAHVRFAFARTAPSEGIVPATA